MRLGEYQTVRELRRSGAASLWEVEPVGGGAGRLAAKILQPPAFWSDEERSARVARFLARARLQEKVAAARKHWAPVHAVGEEAHEAHYVTDLYPSTADQLIRKPKGALDGVGLFRIVRGVVAGLLELKEAEGRSHGRLTAGNVLLTSENPAAASVALSDPAVEKSGSEAGDCRAAGELIYALVMRRAAEPGEVVQPSAAWRALGPRGGRWRELCNQLLDPAQPLDALDALRDAVEACRPPKVSRKQALRVAIVAVLVLGMGVGVWLYREARHKRYVKDWAALCDTADWLPDFVADLKEDNGKRLKLVLPGLPAKYRGDIEALAEAREVRPARIRQVEKPVEQLKLDPPEEAGHSDVVKLVTTIMRGVRAVEEVQKPENWKTLDDAKRVVDKYGPGSKNRAQAIAKAASEVMTPNAAGDNRSRKGFAASFETLVDYSSWLKPLDDLAGSRDVIESPKYEDAKLKGEFADYVADVIGFSSRSSDLTRVQKLSDVAKDLARAVGEMTSGKYDVARFQAERTPVSADRSLTLAAWAKEAAEYRVVEGAENPLRPDNTFNWHEPADEGKPVPWDKVLEGMDADIGQLDKDDPDSVAGRAKLASLSGELDVLKRKRPLVKDKAQVEQELLRFVDEAGAARRSVLKDDEAKVAAFRALVTAEIAALGKSADFVAAAKAKELSRVLGLDWRLGRKQKRVDAVEAFFKELPGDPRMETLDAAADRPWVKQLSSVAKARRDAAVRAALDAVFIDGKTADAAALAAQSKSTREALTAWSGRAEELGRVCVALEDRLNQYPLPTESDGGRSKSVADLRAGITEKAEDKEIVATMAPVVGRADALIKTADLPKAELKRIFDTGNVNGSLPDFMESRLAAWRHAPQDVSLTAANAVRQQLIAHLAKEQGGTPLGDKCVREINEIWRTKIAGPQIDGPPGGEEARVLAEAVALIESGAALLTIDDLKPAGRYNVSAYRLIRAVEKKGLDSELEKLVGDARRAASDAAPKDETASPDTARVAAATGLLESWLDRAKPRTDVPKVSEIGPAAITDPKNLWTYQGPGISYIQNRPPKIRLDFIDLPDAECYMCTTEVSVELFAAVMGAVAPKDLVGLREPLGQVQTWGKAGNSLVAAEDWLTVPGTKAATYVANQDDWSRGLTPRRTLKYPVQYISPGLAEQFAGDMKCQIPTESQWNAALDAELIANPTGTWNLRDQASWKANLAMFPNSPPRWELVGDPDGAKAGAADCWFADGKPPVAGIVPFVNDGHLFFQPVDASVEPGTPANGAKVGRGSVFHHIIGNVAEYVVSDTDKNKFLAAGNSALSPPLPLKQHVPIDPRYMRLGFADLGIRLAIKRPVPAYFVRLNNALAVKDRAGVFITRPH